MKKKETPRFIILGAWLLSFIVFLVGFWHTHLGLKEMRPFNSDNGSLFIAAIILLLMLLSYYFAIAGQKLALAFYVICGFFFFIFNLNYFYPSYLGRELVKEEAIALNDTLQAYASQMDYGTELVQTVSDLYTLKGNLLDEISGQAGFGPRAKDYLNQFNTITGGSLKPNLTVGGSESERIQIATRYNEILDNEIQNFVIKQMAQKGEGNGMNLYLGMKDLAKLKAEYSPKLEEIIKDNSPITLDEVKSHPQISLMQEIVTRIDNSTTQVNEAVQKPVFAALGEAKTRNLGRIAHTLQSVGNRISKLDTWGILLICLFIDLLVPLALYFLLRSQNEEQAKNSPMQARINTKPNRF